MFEYGSDIAVFHGALVSSLERAEFLMDLKSEESCSKENICLQLKKKHCMKIAHTISNAFHELQLEFSSGYEKVDLHRRVHASAFYAVMSSVGKPKDYEGYFESLNGIFPVIDWCLYFELVKAFQWNEYYIECVAALPLDVASKLVELTVNHFEEEPFDYNNMLLDSCIEIIFRHCHFYIFHSISCKEGVSKVTNQEQDKFSNKIPQEATISTLECMVKRVTRCINSVWFFVPEEPVTSNISAIKISINTLLKFFKCVKNSKYEEFALNFIESNSNKTFAMSTSEMCEKLCNSPVKKDEILTLLKYTEDMIKEACRILASCRGKAFITYMHEDFGSTCSWENTSFGSLFHQFVEHLKEFIIMCSILDVPTELQDVISSIKEISVIVNEHSFEASKWLSEVHKLLLWSADTSLHKYHVMMGNVVEKNTFITEESTLELLERSTDLLCKPEYISTLIEIILNYKSPQQERIIKIFLETFQNLEFQEQKSTLSMIIKSHGVTEVFKSSDFSTQLVHFLNQIVKEEKLGSKMHLQVLALCLQSSYDVIKQIISQAIKNKGGIAALVQILKIMSFICNYKNDLHSPSLLIKRFCNIIKDEDLSKQQKENLISLIQVLLQQKSKDKYEVLSSGDVLLWCILPYLQVSTSAGLLDFCIDLLQIVITEVKFWTEEVRKVAVVWCLYQVLEHYTLQRNGEKRQVIITTINLLMSKDISYTEKDLNWLAAHIKNINLVWHLCFELRFFGKSIQQEELEEMPAGDILTGGNFGLTVEISSIALQTKLHKMNPVLIYSYLVISLSKILLYGISDEWIFCFDAVTLSLDDDLQISFMGSFSSDIKKANKNLSKAFHTFVDALILLNAAKVPSTPWHYIISCFNKLVKHIMKEAENDNTFNAFIFCEICRIGSTLDSVYAPDIIVPLLDIANLCKGVYSGDEYLRIIVLNAIDTISAFDAIENLKKILIQTKV